MADTTKIEWTDATWNPITGCTLVSDGCRHCYAATLAATRLKNHSSRAGLARINAAGEAKFTGEVRLNAQWLDQPLRWRKPRRIFVCAHGDLFHENVPDEWIDRVFAVMALAPQHTFQVLTKRPERMAEYANSHRYLWIGDQMMIHAPQGLDLRPLIDAFGNEEEPNIMPAKWPLPNVWLGTSVEDQATADARIPQLLDTPAAVRFISAEPLLGPVDLTRIISPTHRINSLSRTDDGGSPLPRLDWIIVGGESGSRARPMHPDWARSLRDQCTAAGVAFFFKQWGEFEASLDRDRDDPDWSADYSRKYSNRGKSKWLNLAGGRGFNGERFHVMRRVGKSRAGRLLDGREWNEVPG